MRFQNGESSLELTVVNYDCPADEGVPGTDDRNWLTLRCTWIDEDGAIVKDSNTCLLTYELSEMAAGLKVLRSGIKDEYDSAFSEPYFSLYAHRDGEDRFVVAVSFYLPNTMDGDDTAEIACTMSMEEMRALTDELDRLCAKFPDRK